MNPCINCHRPMHSKNHFKPSVNGSVRSGAKGMCGSCYGRYRKEQRGDTGHSPMPRHQPASLEELQAGLKGYLNGRHKRLARNNQVKEQA